MPEITLRTLDQERAKFAVEKIASIKNDSNFNNQEFLKKYKARAKDFQAYVREDLLQGLTFFFSKINGKDQSYKVFLEHITEWFKKAATESNLQIIFSPDVNLEEPLDLIKHIQGLDVDQYLHATQESLAIGGWFKRFADALIEGE